MLAGYFDESGLDERSATFWVAGFVQHFSDWPSFTRQWKKALDDSGLACFHMAELSARPRRGPFKGWSEERADDLIDELITIINTSQVLGFAAGLVKEDYERVVVWERNFFEDVGLKREWWKQPYLLAFQQCIVEAVLKASELPRAERISFWFDRQRQFAARSVAVFGQMSNTGLWPSGDRLGDVRFESKTDCLALQAADLLAWEIRKYSEDRRFNPSKPIRPSMERLKRRLVASPLVDEKHMVRLVEEIRKSRGKIGKDPANDGDTMTDTLDEFPK
jgi:uncharacterized protein DUF3800